MECKRPKHYFWGQLDGGVKSIPKRHAPFIMVNRHQ